MAQAVILDHFRVDLAHDPQPLAGGGDHLRRPARNEAGVCQRLDRDRGVQFYEYRIREIQ